MAFLVYNLLLHLALPFIALKLWWRGRKSPAYKKRILERFGVNQIAVTPNRSIWIHTVSVGEFLAALPLIKRLQICHPELSLIITSMTPTGSEQIIKTLGTTVQHCYLPYDFAWAQQKIMRRWQPQLLLILETELWPNLLRAAHQENVPVIIANARLSERSAQGYQRIASLSKQVMSYIDHVAVQAAADAGRFTALGIAAEKLTITGSIKSDISVSEHDEERAKITREQWLGKTSHQSERAIFIAASTHQGEDEIVLDAFRQLQKKIPHALLVLVPRHPERFDSVARLIQSHSFSFTRRSQTTDSVVGATTTPNTTEVILADTMGELMVLLGASDAVFVGGSLLEGMGGHNILEPIAWGKGVIVGPYMTNFQTLFDEFHQAEGVIQIESASQLANSFYRLFSDKAYAAQICSNSQIVLNENKGALDALLKIVENEIKLGLEQYK